MGCGLAPIGADT